MLVLSRKFQESVLIDDDTLIVITEFRAPNGNTQVRLGIITPRERRVLRSEKIQPGDELYDRFMARGLLHGPADRVGLPKPGPAAYDSESEGPLARDLAGEE